MSVVIQTSIHFSVQRLSPEFQAYLAFLHKSTNYTYILLYRMSDMTTTATDATKPITAVTRIMVSVATRSTVEYSLHSPHLGTQLSEASSWKKSFSHCRAVEFLGTMFSTVSRSPPPPRGTARWIRVMQQQCKCLHIATKPQQHNKCVQTCSYNMCGPKWRE